MHPSLLVLALLAGCPAGSKHSTSRGDTDSGADTETVGTERCNGIDDDGDGIVDEATAADAPTWYADADEDGYGDAAVSAIACDPPTAFVSDATDCDDADEARNPGALELCDEVDNDCDSIVDEPTATDAPTWYADEDEDGYGDAAASAVACAPPAGFVSAPSDCDDTDASLNPAMSEVCDAVDNNCDGTVDEPAATDAAIWYADGDKDGYGDVTVSQTACDAPVDYVSDATDCDDANASAHPTGTEICDAADNNCDGTVDEPTATDAATWYADTDGDGYGDAAAPVIACDPGPGFVADASDCDDTNAGAHPTGTEVCDTADNNCDGVIDESTATDAPTWYADADGDGYGDPTHATVACTAPSGAVERGDDCDDSNADEHPDAPERWNLRDDDCDGVIDEDADRTWVPPFPTSREAWRWPFSPDSAWNQPVGTGLLLEDAVDPCTVAIGDTIAGAWINAAEWSHPVVLADAGDPWVSVTEDGSVVATVQSPADATPADPAWPDGDNHLHIVDATGTVVTETWLAHWLAGGWSVASMAQVDLLGTGIGSGGVRIYGGSAVGGLIRAGETETGIWHALAVSLPVSSLEPSIVWPATSLDTSRTDSMVGVVPVGQHLALPPDVDEGIVTTPAGLALLRALRDYGAYVVDHAGNFAFYAEPDMEAEIDPARDDLDAILRELRCSTNSTEASPGGPGDRVGELAPAFP